LAQRTILGQVASGLTHQPDRRVRSGFPSRGTEQREIVRCHRASVPARGRWNQGRAGFMIRTMPYISGQQAFPHILRDEGVSVMFGNPGTTELPLMDGLARQPDIHYVLALQEAVAVAMADGYAQATGGLAAVNVHVSPGLGNAMGMLYDAYKAG